MKAAPSPEVLDLVSAYLEDKSPLACAASYARCCCHFSSYLAAGDVWIKISCKGCQQVQETRVTGHEHVGGLIRYLGSPEDYVWDTSLDCLYCGPCGDAAVDRARAASEALALPSSLFLRYENESEGSWRTA